MSVCVTIIALAPLVLYILDNRAWFTLLKEGVLKEGRFFKGTLEIETFKESWISVHSLIRCLPC